MQYYDVEDALICAVGVVGLLSSVLLTTVRIPGTLKEALLRLILDSYFEVIDEEYALQRHK